MAYEDPTGGGGGGRPDPNAASWLPPGATLNPDGSVSLPGGKTMPAPPPGYTRDPNTGVVSFNGTAPIQQGVNGPPDSSGNYTPSPWLTAQGPTPTTQTPTPGPGPGPNPGPGQLPSPFTSNFTPPSMLNLGGPNGINYIPPTPQFQAPGYKQAPAFTYDAFKAPSMQDVLNDPGYQFPLQQGLGAISNSKAAQGLWATGETGKAMQDYGQNYANQFYGNIYNRDLSTYQQNFGNALNAYTTNYGTQYAAPNAYNYQAAKDTFAPQILGYQTQAAAGQHQNDQNYQQAYDKWLADFDQKYRTGSFLRDTANA